MVGALIGLGGLALSAYGAYSASKNASAAQGQQQDQYNQYLERLRVDPEQKEAQHRLLNLQKELLAQALGKKGGFSPESESLSQAYQKQNQLAFNREQEQIRGGIQGGIQDLMDKNRQLMGGGSSGHIMEGILNMEQQKGPLMEQAESRATDRERAQAMSLMDMMNSTAFGQPMGNFAYSPGMPPSPSANQIMPQYFQQLGSAGMSMAPYLMQDNKGAITNNKGIVTDYNQGSSIYG